MSLVDDFREVDELGFRSSCGGITPEMVRDASLKSPQVAGLIERVMMAGLAVRDAKGHQVRMRLPPALALAIIQIVLQ